MKLGWKQNQADCWCKPRTMAQREYRIKLTQSWLCQAICFLFLSFFLVYLCAYVLFTLRHRAYIFKVHSRKQHSNTGVMGSNLKILLDITAIQTELSVLTTIFITVTTYHYFCQENYNYTTATDVSSQSWDSSRERNRPNNTAHKSSRWLRSLFVCATKKSALVPRFKLFSNWFQQLMSERILNQCQIYGET